MSSGITGRELVVMVNPDVGLRASGTKIASIAGADVSPLAEVVLRENVELFPLFGISEERLKDQAATIATIDRAEPPDLSVFYKVAAADDRLEALAERLRIYKVVEAAFVKPPTELPLLNNMLPLPDPAPPSTTDFTSRQGYLHTATEGIDALFAKELDGGGGKGVNIIDIEGAWRFSHEDLSQNQGGIIAGLPTERIDWRNHGTAVVGAIGGDRNGFGVTGICPDANVRAISIFDSNTQGWGSAAAIRLAAHVLNPGDIILLELHRAGPRFNFQERDDQRGYIAIEWWPDDLAAIQFAASRGIIVVEAGGNGAQNLDESIYDVNPSSPHGPFPSTWRNPFRRTLIDSGAIIVGAGAPPPGTHGNDHGPDRSRLSFSNFGAAFDAQGWGREVTTCGYGDLQGGSIEDLWYTDSFAGTSSASPIVVGALACVQGILRAAGKPLLTPAQARNLLRTSGSPQQDGPIGSSNQRIGNRPDIRAMVHALLEPPVVDRRSLNHEANGVSPQPLTIQIPGPFTIRIDAGVR